MANKIFVANLPWTINRRELRDYFSKFGKIVYSQVLFNRSTGLSKYMGFLKYNDARSYEDVLKREHILENHKLNIYPAHENRSNNRNFTYNQPNQRVKHTPEINMQNIMK